MKIENINSCLTKISDIDKAMMFKLHSFINRDTGDIGIDGFRTHVYWENNSLMVIADTYLTTRLANGYCEFEFSTPQLTIKQRVNRIEKHLGICDGPDNPTPKD